MKTQNHNLVLQNKSSEVSLKLPEKFMKKLTIDSASGDTIVSMSKETAKDYSLTVKSFKHSELTGVSGFSEDKTSYKFGKGTTKITLSSLSGTSTFK